MITLSTIEEMRRRRDHHRRNGESIGLIPTMGALHEGHLSLIALARKQCQVVVVSIYVNPSQFGTGEDFNRYPKDSKGDLRKCRDWGTDYVFMPKSREIYPLGYKSWIHIQDLEDTFEGASRPGHFRGVATIVLKLFNIIMPQRAYFGLKDYQQTIMIRQMVQDLNLSIQVVGGPTVRENDGLAFSSRNRYLSKSERRSAPILWKALNLGREAIQRGVSSVARVRTLLVKRISEETNVKIDYVSIVDPKSLMEVKSIQGTVLLALAVRIGRTRLIDNLIVNPRSQGRRKHERIGSKK